MKFRRGFKTEANQIATEIRTELGLSKIAPFDPWALAEHLAIDILPLTEMLNEAPSVTHFLNEGRDTFSAMTVFCGTARLIVHNDKHSKGRQNSNITHELSHALLQHHARVISRITTTSCNATFKRTRTQKFQLQIRG